ncbi:MAG: bystin family protein [archaeon]|nr:bystin family protein [archaeon]
MPKARRIGASGHALSGQRPSLGTEILNDESLEGVRRRDRGKAAKRAAKRAPERQSQVPAKISTKILREARAQLAEIEEEQEPDHLADSGAASSSSSQARSSFNSSSRGGDEDDLEDGAFSSEEDEADIDRDIEDEVELNMADAEALSMWMSREPPNRRTLHEVVMERLKKLESKELEHGVEAAPRELVDKLKRRLDPAALKVYSDVGRLLQSYTAGRVPVAFKMLPRMDDWEELLWLTSPGRWSAAAMYYATRIFASNLNARLAQRFFNLVLYPRLRADIQANKKLHFNLYLALKKALYKPGAFFKGILLPLCEERNATLREALIIGSVLKRRTIPVLHSAAALMRIASMEYSGVNSIFIKIFIEKKYALPRMVVDALFEHFLKFAHIDRAVPVLWHQSFLAFAQRYKTDLTREQKQELKLVLRQHPHQLITPLIKQELYTSLSRDDMKSRDDPNTKE